MKSDYCFNNIKKGKFLIKSIHNPNPKFSGMGIVEGNIIEIIRFTKWLVHFRICNTEMFSRRTDINIQLSEI